MQPNSGISMPVVHERIRKMRACVSSVKVAPNPNKPRSVRTRLVRPIISSSPASSTPKTKLARCGSGVYLSACSHGPQLQRSGCAIPSGLKTTYSAPGISPSIHTPAHLRQVRPQALRPLPPRHPRKQKIVERLSRHGPRRRVQKRRNLRNPALQQQAASVPCRSRTCHAYARRAPAAPPARPATG